MEHLKETGHIMVVVSGTLTVDMIFIIVAIYVDKIKIIILNQILRVMKDVLTVI